MISFRPLQNSVFSDQRNLLWKHLGILWKKLIFKLAVDVFIFNVHFWMPKEGERFLMIFSQQTCLQQLLSVWKQFKRRLFFFQLSYKNPIHTVLFLVELFIFIFPSLITENSLSIILSRSLYFDIKPSSISTPYILVSSLLKAKSSSIKYHLRAPSRQRPLEIALTL